MTFSPDHLRDIIRLSLRPLNKWSPEAEEIMMMLAAHESGLGRYLRQIGGPARGIYGMEPETERDIWHTYLAYRVGLVVRIGSISGVSAPSEEQLQYNPLYSTIMARLKIWRAKGPLPPADDVEKMSVYAKKVYNSRLGKATPEKYAADYVRLISADERDIHRCSVSNNVKKGNP